MERGRSDRTHARIGTLTGSLTRLARSPSVEAVSALRGRFGWSLSNLAALLRQQLFVYRDLRAWLDEPFEPPPQAVVASAQLALPLAWR